MKIIKNYLTRNRCYQQNVKRIPVGIQLHTIGTAQGTAQSVADYWNQSSVSACVTYIVDCDTEGKSFRRCRRMCGPGRTPDMGISI